MKMWCLILALCAGVVMAADKQPLVYSNPTQGTIKVATNDNIVVPGGYVKSEHGFRTYSQTGASGSNGVTSLFGGGLFVGSMDDLSNYIVVAVAPSISGNTNTLWIMTTNLVTGATNTLWISTTNLVTRSTNLLWIAVTNQITLATNGKYVPTSYLPLITNAVQNGQNGVTNQNLYLREVVPVTNYYTDARWMLEVVEVSGPVSPTGVLGRYYLSNDLSQGMPKFVHESGNYFIGNLDAGMMTIMIAGNEGSCFEGQASQNIYYGVEGYGTGTVAISEIGSNIGELCVVKSHPDATAAGYGVVEGEDYSFSLSSCQYLDLDGGMLAGTLYPGWYLMNFADPSTPSWYGTGGGILNPFTDPTYGSVTFTANWTNTPDTWLTNRVSYVTNDYAVPPDIGVTVTGLVSRALTNATLQSVLDQGNTATNTMQVNQLEIGTNVSLRIDGASALAYYVGAVRYGSFSASGYTFIGAGTHKIMKGSTGDIKFALWTGSGNVFPLLIETNMVTTTNLTVVGRVYFGNGASLYASGSNIKTVSPDGSTTNTFLTNSAAFQPASTNFVVTVSNGLTWVDAGASTGFVFRFSLPGGGFTNVYLP